MRIGKIALVFALGLFMLLAGLNNVLTLGDGQFSANSAVKFAVGMQETGQHPNLMWRAIESPLIIWFAVICIIITELASGILSLWGAWKMWAARAASTIEFKAGKERALQGLTIMAVFYLLAFQTIVGEWFMIWQTPAPTLSAAFINFAMAILVMIWVNTNDE